MVCSIPKGMTAAKNPMTAPRSADIVAEKIINLVSYDSTCNEDQPKANLDDPGKDFAQQVRHDHVKQILTATTPALKTTQT